jgi:hypothetical protein
MTSRHAATAALFGLSAPINKPTNQPFQPMTNLDLMIAIQRAREAGFVGLALALETILRNQIKAHETQNSTQTPNP